MDPEIKRRLVKWGLIAGGSLAGLVLILLISVLLYARSLASGRSDPVETERFLTRDTSGVLLVSLQPSDDGVDELFDQIAAGYDAARAAKAGFWEKLGYWLVGFDRPSELITRPLPAEIAVVVRYDETAERFNSYAVYSVSGLARLISHGSRHLSRYAPGLAKEYEARTYEGETFFVPRSASLTRSDRLRARDVKMLVPGGGPPACWSVADNNVLLANHPDSLESAIDRLGAIRAGEGQPRGAICSILPPHLSDVDIRGALLNRHGELAGLLTVLGEVRGAEVLRRWLAAQSNRRLLSAVESVTIAADVQPDDRVLITARFAHAPGWPMERFFTVLEAALRSCRPAPPMRLEVQVSPSPGEVEVQVIVSGLGAYYRGAAEATAD